MVASKIGGPVVSRKHIFAAALMLVATLSPNLLAQWPRLATSNVPKTPDGKVNLDAPTPKAADGKPDLSGVWETVPCRGCGVPVISGLGSAPPQGRGGATAAGATPPPAPTPAPAATPAPAGPPPGSGNVFGNIGGQTQGGAPYQPWAADLVKKRMADNSKDNPDAHCLPMGIMQLNSHPFPRKIIQTPTEVVIIYEGSGTTVREIFLDGRALPGKDAEPWWNGYSVGHWEGDTLVVETAGFMDDGWLDVRGSPLTSEGRMTERFRRTSYGNLELTVTIDDPKAYTKPFSVVIHNRLAPDLQLSEFVCIDKDAAHYLGGK
jgi:hypothetical protein